MKKTFILISFLFVTTELNAQEENGFEKRMYNIYSKHYSKEVNDEKWAAYLRSIGSRTYQVQGGDTLWDLSVVFFGDGMFWSKIWSYNERLTNPHLLSVGQNIHFYAGSVEQAPGVSVGEKLEKPQKPAPESEPETLPGGFKEVVIPTQAEAEAKAVQEIDGGMAEPMDPGIQGRPQMPLRDPRKGMVSKANQLYPGAPAIPPPRRLVKPVLKTLPSTFVDSLGYDANAYDDNGMSFDVRPPVRVNPLFVAHSFLYGNNFENYPRVGRIMESENRSKLVGANQFVYIRSKNKLEPGERLTAMGNGYPFDRNGYTGNVIQYQGTVEILGPMKKKDYYHAKVIKSLSGIKGAPWVTREKIPTFDDDYVGRPNEKKLQIIGGGHDNTTSLFGQSDVVYLGGGSKQGVRVGDVFGIYKRRDVRFREFYIKRSPLPIGHLKVFRSEPNVSSAFVLDSKEVILPGDETGAPVLIEAVATESERKDLNDIESGLDFGSGS